MNGVRHDLSARFKNIMRDYASIIFDYRARFGDKQIVKSTGQYTFSVKQIIIDPEEHNSWALSGHVDFVES